MIVDTIITGVTNYFTSKSVSSLNGYKKVKLIDVDNFKIPTGLELEIDATTDLSVSISKQLMQYSSESKKVYMDGTKINPIKMSINGHIETSKLQQIQDMAKDDKWMYVSMTKDIGGSFVSMSEFGQTSIGRVVENVMDLGDTLFGSNEPSTDFAIYSDCKLYTIQSLSINDEGYKNTVGISLELCEVVLFDMDVVYEFGVKQSDGGGGGSQGATLGKDTDIEVKYDSWETNPNIPASIKGVDE